MGTKPINIPRIARGKLEKNVDKEFDNAFTQIENIINDNNVFETKVFYTAATSGGTVNVKNTIKLNKYGKIISWEEQV